MKNDVKNIEDTDKKRLKEFGIELAIKQFHGDIECINRWKTLEPEIPTDNFLDLFIYLLDKTWKNHEYITLHAEEFVCMMRQMEISDKIPTREIAVNATATNKEVQGYKKLQKIERKQSGKITSYREIYGHIIKKLNRSDKDVLTKNLFSRICQEAEDDDTLDNVNTTLSDHINALYNHYAIQLSNFGIHVKRAPTMRKPLRRLLFDDAWTHAVLPTILTMNAVSMAFYGANPSKLNLLKYPQFKKSEFTVAQLDIINAITESLYDDIKFAIMESSMEIYSTIGYPEWSKLTSSTKVWHDEIRCGALELKKFGILPSKTDSSDTPGQVENTENKSDPIIFNCAKAFVMPILRTDYLQEIVKTAGKDQTIKLTTANIGTMIYSLVFPAKSIASNCNPAVVASIKSMRKFACPECYISGHGPDTARSMDNIREEIKNERLFLSDLCDAFSYDNIADIFTSLLMPTPFRTFGHNLSQLDKFEDYITEDINLKLYRKLKMKKHGKSDEIIATYKRRYRRIIEDNLTAGLAIEFLRVLSQYESANNQDWEAPKEQLSQALHENAVLSNTLTQCNSITLWSRLYNLLLENALNLILDEVYFMYQLAFLHYHHIFDINKST